MTLGATPTPAQVVEELRESFPYTFPDIRSRWLADAAVDAPLVFPTSFSNKSSVKVVDSMAETAGSGSKTFSNVNFGLAFTDRVLVACTCLYRTGLSALDITSVTIGGVSATGYDNGEYASSVSRTIGAGIWAAAVPAGTSGNVVINHGGTAQHSGLILLAVKGISTTPHDQQTIPASSMGIGGSGGGSASDTINVPEDGVTIVVSNHSNTNDTTLSGVTEQEEITVGGGRMCVGFDNRMSAETSRAYSGSWSGTAARGFVARSFSQPIAA